MIIDNFKLSDGKWAKYEWINLIKTEKIIVDPRVLLRLEMYPLSR